MTENGFIEVDEQRDGQAAELCVGDCLSVMNGQKALDSLDLDYHLAGYDQIESKAQRQLDAFVENRLGPLPVE